MRLNPSKTLGSTKNTYIRAMIDIERQSMKDSNATYLVALVKSPAYGSV